MPIFMTAPEVNSKQQKFASSIFESWVTLASLVAQHEVTIRKRWLQKTREKRRQILLTAWPEMAPTHRPDLAIFRRSGSSRSEQAKRSAYLFPYINVEDLLVPKTLLLFLNIRARNQPHAFAAADMEACHFAITSQAINRGFLNEHVMMFAGRTDANTYGELIPWKAHPDAFNWMMTGYGANPGDGLIILEVQERLYRFLLDCCREILGDLGKALQQESSPPEPPSLLVKDTSVATMSVSAAEAPYRLPADLSLERLESVVEGKALAAEDHLWSLREDPGYFATTLLVYKEHRQEMMLDTNGKKHPLVVLPSQEYVLWERILKNAIVTAIAQVEIWHATLVKVRAARELQNKYAASILPEKALPEEFAFALYTLLHHLTQYTKGPMGSLRISVVASPAFRPCFVRLPQSPASSVIQVEKRPNLSKNPTRDTLIWMFMTLFDEQQLHLVGMHNLMDELQMLLDNEPEARAFISSWVADQLSELAVLSYCKSQIEMYQPWSSTFEDAMAAQTDDIQADFMRSQNSFAKYFQVKLSDDLVGLAIPSQGRYRYPVDKKRSRDNVEAMCSAENGLDAFWSKMDAALKGAYASSPNVSRLLKTRSLQRTSEWIEPTKVKAPMPESQEVPHHQLRHDLEQRSESTIDHSLVFEGRKIKTKSRAAVAKENIAPSSSANALETADMTPDPSITVDKRALKVFKTLFFTPSPDAQPGQVPWLDFVYALVSTGFEAEKLYGSVWQFSPTKLDVERPIQFHEPHPSGKIAFVVARRYGRRLKRAYGWHGETFALSTIAA